tara:strand:- start:1496 stop:2095 length:600 start_codon:yes stop_codon:yes gene_type:complete
VIPLQLSGAEYRSAAVAIGPPAGAAVTVNWRSNVDPVDLTARLFRQLVQLIGAIVPPAVTVNWRSNVDPVDLTARLFRQLVQLIGAIVPPAGAVNWRSSVDPVDLTARLFRQLVQLMQLIGVRAAIRWIWAGRCAPIFSASWHRIGADRSRLTALSSSSLSIVGYLGTRSTRSNHIPRASDLGPVGLSNGAGCGGCMCH